MNPTIYVDEPWRNQPGGVLRIKGQRVRFTAKSTRILAGPWKGYAALIGVTPRFYIDRAYSGIGRAADAMTWPWPSWCCRTRPYDWKHDDRKDTDE